VTFAGYVSREEQALWYAGAALFLYPSLYEGFGLPVAEALACGTPTITSNVSSLPEVGGPVAMQVAPTDADALAYAMRVALSDPGLRARMLVEGPAWTRQFSMERLARQYALVYREAAQRPR
jgi:glycosyltransferase involved in cell wall biosynthesis